MVKVNNVLESTGKTLFNMRVIKILGVILVSILYFCNITLAKEYKERCYSLGIISRGCQWTSAKMSQTKQKIYENEVIWNPESIAKLKSDAGILWGPEVEYLNKKFFIRGFYLLGSSYNFPDNGKAQLNNFGADIGYQPEGNFASEFFAGYRQISVEYSFKDSQLTNHNISDAVLGFRLGSRNDKIGFSGNIGVTFGVRGLFDALDNFGESNYIIEKPLIVEGEITFGYRFRRVPLSVIAGYGGWGYEKPIRKRKEGINEITEYWQDSSFGPTFEVVYGF